MDSPSNVRYYNVKTLQAEDALVRLLMCMILIRECFPKEGTFSAGNQTEMALKHTENLHNIKTSLVMTIRYFSTNLILRGQYKIFDSVGYDVAKFSKVGTSKSLTYYILLI